MPAEHSKSRLRKATLKSIDESLVTLTVAQENLPEKLILRLAGLRVIAGPDRHQQFRLNEMFTVIGTDAAADIVLHDPTVSARHAEIGLRPQGLLLRNLGSRNGVVANQLRVEQVYLSPRLVLTLGKTSLEVVDLQEINEVALSPADHFGLLIGRSATMRRVYALLDQVKDTDTTVLIEGETGTGKEVVAQSLHQESNRADKPLVIFDCSAVAPNLLESELFGHERGAFTGATSAHQGALARAHGGTLFLDEIGELSLELQPKLLRAMEAHEYKPIGCSTSKKVDVRVIAATSRNLEHEVAAKKFRQDLFYRLAVMRVRLPPLRERLDDLPLLIQHFSDAQGGAENNLADKIPGIVQLLSSYQWPGNVRELRNFVERLNILPLDSALPSAIFAQRQLQPQLPEGVLRYSAARDQALDRFEQQYIRELLQHTKGNVTHAAQLAGISRRYLTQLIKKGN